MDSVIGAAAVIARRGHCHAPSAINWQPDNPWVETPYEASRGDSCPGFTAVLAVFSSGQYGSSLGDVFSQALLQSIWNERHSNRKRAYTLRAKCVIQVRQGLVL